METPTYQPEVEKDDATHPTVMEMYNDFTYNSTGLFPETVQHLQPHRQTLLVPQAVAPLAGQEVASSRENGVGAFVGIPTDLSSTRGYLPHTYLQSSYSVSQAQIVQQQTQRTTDLIPSSLSTQILGGNASLVGATDPQVVVHRQAAVVPGPVPSVVFSQDTTVMNNQTIVATHQSTAVPDQILNHGVAPHLHQAPTVLPVAQLPSHVFSTVDPTNQIIPVEQSSQNVDIVNQPVIVQQNGMQESDQEYMPDADNDDGLEEGEVPSDQCLEEGEVRHDEEELLKDSNVLDILKEDSDATDIEPPPDLDKHKRGRKKKLSKKTKPLIHCDLCDEQYRLPSQLKKHILEKHTLESTFPCKMCDKKFREEYHLRDHIINQHQSDSEFLCPICDKVFGSPAQVKRHMAKHGIDIKTTKIKKMTVKPTKRNANHASSTSSSIDFDHENDKDSENLTEVDEPPPTIKQEPRGRKHVGRKKSTISHACDICLKEFQSVSLLRKHKVSTHSKETKSYECEVCSKCFTDTASLDQHMASHSNKAMYKCGLCDQGFTNARQLKQHVRRHASDDLQERRNVTDGIQDFNGKKAWVDSVNKTTKPSASKSHRCESCGAEFKTSKQLKSHVTKEHPGTQTQSCSVCGETFLTIQAYNIHMQDHKKRFECQECKQCFNTERQMNKHMVTHNPDHMAELVAKRKKAKSLAAKTKERKYACGHCGKKFPTPSHLRDHELIHADNREFKCTQCPKEFTLERQLKSHTMVVHGESKFICGLCGKKFATAGSLKLHGYRHSNKKPYQCSICNKGFLNKLNLNDHVSIHKNQKNYTCSICGNGYHCLSSLWLHNRTKHLGRKKHKCKLCGECFTFQRQLESHVYKHTGKKDFYCNICAKSFIRKESLKMHMRLHTGEKLHVCASCGKAFINAYKLNRHMNTHNNTNNVGNSRPNKNPTRTASHKQSDADPLLDAPTRTKEIPAPVLAEPSIVPPDGAAILDASKAKGMITEEPSVDSRSLAQQLAMPTSAPGADLYRAWQLPFGVEALPAQNILEYQTPNVAQWENQPGTFASQEVTHRMPLVNTVQQPCVRAPETNTFPAFQWVSPGNDRVIQTIADPMATCMNANGIPTADTFTNRDQLPFDAQQLLNQPTYVQTTRAIAPVANTFIQPADQAVPAIVQHSVPQTTIPTQMPSTAGIPAAVISHVPHQPQVVSDVIPQSVEQAAFVPPEPPAPRVNHVVATKVSKAVDNAGKPRTRHPILTSSSTTKSPHADRIAQNVPNHGPNILEKTRRKQTLAKKHLPKPAPTILKTTRMFPCDLCQKQFVSQFTLKKHLLAKHKKSRPYACKLCPKTFIQPNHLKDHLLIHTKDNNNQCLRCDKTFTLLRQLQRHMILKHSKHVTAVPVVPAPASEESNQKPTCHICKKEFPIQSTLKRHMRAHDRSKCITCGKQFLNTLELKAHIETSTTCEYRHKCIDCDKTFESPCHLKSHMLRHKLDRPFVCETCGKRFYEAGTLKLHTYIHTEEKPFTCPICNKGFVNRLNLNDHVSIHTNEKRYVCPLCGNGYHCLSSLWLHNRTKHLGAKDHQCKLCGEQFTYARQLESHMYKHTGKKDYNCHTCGKSFIRAETLKMHTRLHTGEKLFECPVCKKAFITAYKLRRHSATHNDKRFFTQM